mmetsp:Transcript_28077/g.60976  ORF Transcript_28077/g.60976 Transcript_28077/m.60976 type:complete len:735 (-) Transcript_28077:195-2399(-)
MNLPFNNLITALPVFVFLVVSACHLPTVDAIILADVRREKSPSVSVVSHTCSCLALEPKRSTLRLAASECEHGSLLQTWSFDDASKQLRSSLGSGVGEERCLHTEQDGTLTLQACHPAKTVGPAQQWIRRKGEGHLRNVLHDGQCLQAGGLDGLELAPCLDKVEAGSPQAWSLLESPSSPADSSSSSSFEGAGVGKAKDSTIKDGLIPVVSGAGSSEFNGPYNYTGEDNGQKRFARDGGTKETLNYADGWWILAKGYSGCWYRAAAGSKGEFPGPKTIWQMCPETDQTLPIGKSPLPKVVLDDQTDVDVADGEGEFSTCPKNCKCPVLFDCDVGIDNWNLGWSNHKKHYCCTNANSTMQSRICTTTTTSTHAPPASHPFDCMAGLANWRFGWSEMKQKACCQEFHQGYWALEDNDECEDCYYTWCCANAVQCTTTTTTAAHVIAVVVTTTTTLPTTTPTPTVAVVTTEAPAPAHCSRPSSIAHVMYGDECLNQTVVGSGTCCNVNCPTNTFACVTKGSNSYVGAPCCSDGVLDPPTYWCAIDANCSAAFEVEEEGQATVLLQSETPRNSPPERYPEVSRAGLQREKSREYSAAQNADRSKTCADLPHTGIKFRSGPPAKCSDLAEYCTHKSSVLAQKVRKACQETCGMCSLMVDEMQNDAPCEDAHKSAAPVLTVGGSPISCTQAKGFCSGHQDSDLVANKCPLTCERCTRGPASQFSEGGSSDSVDGADAEAA